MTGKLRTREDMTWVENKQMLIDTGYLHEIFSLSVEKVAARELAFVVGDPHYGYEPRLFHQLLASVSSLLERVLVFRREARDLEILATKVAMDYQLFDQTTLLDEDLDILRLGLAARKLAQETHDNTAKAFGEGDQLQNGFRSANLGRVAEIDVELSNLEAQENIIHHRYKLHRDYQAAYRLKHTELGNAHNYADRCQRLIVLFQQDLREAYLKSKAIVIALKTLWGFDLAVPDPESTFFIDELIDWNRDAIRFLEFIDQVNVTYDLTIPFTQPCVPDCNSIIQPDEFQRLLHSGNVDQPIKFDFRLEPKHFSFAKVRLLEVGFAYGNALDLVSSTGMDRNATKDSYAKLRVSLTPPTQEYSGSLFLPATTVQLGNVGLFNGGASVDRCSSNAVHYLDPVGKWSVEVSPLAVYKDDSSQLVRQGITGSAPISDFKLHLRLVVINPLADWPIRLGG